MKKICTSLPKLLTIKELSEQISIPISTLYKWTHESQIPHIKMPNTSVRFDPAQIEKWLRMRTINVNTLS